VELIDRIPGRQTDRKTPLGELNWIFTAITDTIAWNILPRALFQRLFRQDLLVASLFRNFLLAERIMRANYCTPISIPALPPTHQVRASLDAKNPNRAGLFSASSRVSASRAVCTHVSNSCIGWRQRHRNPICR